ncbi:MAG TPA: hypothetical protein VF550_03100 [Polyangia bacterium]
MRTLLCFVVALALACTHRAPAPVVSWDTEVGVLAAGSNALYSWRFYGEREAHYTVGLHAPTLRQACESYSHLGDTNSDYWYVALDFDDTVAGTYQVASAGSADGGAKSVAVSLLHRFRGSFKESYTAVAGEVTIAVAPTFADSRAGESLRLMGWLSWPAVPKTTVRCSGSFTLDGGVVQDLQASCQCKDSLGVESTCETAPMENCCAKATDDNLLRFEVPATDAKPCVSMCRYAVGVPDLCSQELGGTGADGSLETGSPSTSCRGTHCEGLGWPDLAVRFASDKISTGDVQFIFPDGRVFSADSQGGGCPMWPPQIPAELSCAAGIIVGMTDTEVTVRVAPAGLVAGEETVKVGPKNYCAAHIAYVTVSVADGAVEISTPEYRSPCVELGL